VSASVEAAPSGFDDVLAQIESGAAERDGEATPRFPAGPIGLLERSGMLAWNARAGPSRPSAADELTWRARTGRSGGSSTGT
jgi:hypothetical protein